MAETKILNCRCCPGGQPGDPPPPGEPPPNPSPGCACMDGMHTLGPCPQVPMLWRLHSGLGSPFPNGDTLLQYVGDVIILPGAPCPMWETSERVCGKGAAFQGGCAVRDDSQALVPLWSMRFKASSLFAGCAGWLTQPEGCCGLELVAAYTQPAMGFVPERCCTRAFWSANPVAGFAAAACLGRNYFVDASQGFPILDLWVEPYIP